MKFIFFSAFFVLVCSCDQFENEIKSWASKKLEKISGSKLLVRDFYIEEIDQIADETKFEFFLDAVDALSQRSVQCTAMVVYRSDDIPRLDMTSYDCGGGFVKRSGEAGTEPCTESEEAELRKKAIQLNDELNMSNEAWDLPNVEMFPPIQQPQLEITKVLQCTKMENQYSMIAEAREDGQATKCTITATRSNDDYNVAQRQCQGGD